MDKTEVFVDSREVSNSGRRFILGSSEDWACKEEYNEADRRLEGLAWVT